MPARFFVDENDLALGKALATEHPGIVYPGHPDLPEVPRGTLDDDWLRTVGQKRLVVITRDKHIYRRPVERNALVAHLVRGFVLTGRASQSTADSRAILDRHWDEIEFLVANEPRGPWRRAVTSHGLRSITLG